MNTKPNLRIGRWIRTAQPRAARTATLLLLLLTLPAAAQAQFSCTINNDAITITQFAISQYFSLLTVQMGRLTNGTQNQHCL